MEFQRTLFIQATPAEVWKTLTVPERMNTWLSESPTVVSPEREPGSVISFRGELHGYVYEDKALVIRWEPERLWTYRYYSQFTGTEDQPESWSLMSFELQPEGQGTRLHFSHSELLLETTLKHAMMYWTITLGLIKQQAEQGSIKP